MASIPYLGASLIALPHLKRLLKVTPNLRYIQLMHDEPGGGTRLPRWYSTIQTNTGRWVQEIGIPETIDFSIPPAHFFYPLPKDVSFW